MTAAHPFRAILLFNVGLMLFACMDTTNKYLAASFDVPMIAACRYGGHLLLMLAFFGPRRAREMVHTERTGLVWLRAICLCGSTMFVVLAFKRMPVAETSAIVFLTPILVALAAGPLLGETIGWRGWAGALLGFIGVVLIVRPGSGLDAVGVLYAMGCAVASATYNLLSRLLASTERTIALLFYTALVGTILFGGALPWYWADRVPTAFEALLLASLAVYGGLGHFLFTAAFREAPASVLSPISYLQLLWVSLLGWLVFDHIPDPVSLLGMAIIGASGVLVALKSRRGPVEEVA
ncbi:DMT family transporter [Sphingobium nicotianae]|uniref:DMT family transporter n=1 Tax=Sphingobium nicotianae TaxID=2782607 RepID=A0A9X1DBX8_9SPHN|nr:DMT family transporter [Sphingobium nicotianae]MBT2187103.1 DMT family transporter [Sphingobium nicotianae]